MSKLDLGEILANNAPFSKVPESGTKRKQIEYIDIALIDSDPNNFYELSGIEDLADNINTCNGLQQPILVRTNPDDPSRVVITSGHRRRAALEMLIKGGREDLREVPCIRNDEHTSPALQKFMLILANRDTRKMTSAEISKQYEETVATLYQLQEEGYVFEGRMRDHAAEACGISKTRASNLEVIRKNLVPAWKELWESNEVNESLALTVARLPAEHQELLFESRAINIESRCGYYEPNAKADGDRLAKLDKLICPRTKGPCENKQEKWRRVRSMSPYSYEICSNKCCSTCSELARCKMACPKLADKVKKLRADAKQRRDQEQLAKEARDRPEVEQITALWARFAEAREAAGLSIEEYCNAAGIYTDERMKKAWPVREIGGKITRDTGMPYCGGNGFSLGEVRRLLKTAEVLGVSLDYLFLRTDDPRVCFVGKASDEVEPVPTVSSVKGFWRTKGQIPNEGQEIIVVEESGYASDETFKGGRLLGSVVRWEDVRFWTPMPEYAMGEHQAEGQLMFCGWMPGGTTPVSPCEVVAIFALENGVKNKQFLQWTGSEFAFRNGAKIDMEPLKWMQLPPDEEGM